MDTQPLHLLTFKCAMFPRSPSDSGDCICGLPAVGSLSLAFMLAQSLLWSDQTLTTHVPSSASGHVKQWGNMGNRCEYIGMCMSVWEDLTSVWPTDVKQKSLLMSHQSCRGNASNHSDCNIIVKTLAFLMCLFACIWSRRSCWFGLWWLNTVTAVWGGEVYSVYYKDLLTSICSSF